MIAHVHRNRKMQDSRQRYPAWVAEVSLCVQRHGPRLASRDSFIRVRHLHYLLSQSTLHPSFVLIGILENLANRPPSSVIVAPPPMIGFFTQGIRGRHLFRTQFSHTTRCPRITRQPILTPPIIYIFIYISLPAKVYYLAHRCRCTYTYSTICLHIGPTAPSPLLK